MEGDHDACEHRFRANEQLIARLLMSYKALLGIAKVYASGSTVTKEVLATIIEIAERNEKEIR